MNLRDLDWRRARRERTNATFAWLAGICSGAGAMYLLDTDSGRRRRALLRDEAVHELTSARRVLGTEWRDLRNRTWGVAARLRSRTRTDQAGDRQLCERVRSAMGRAVSHPAAMHVEARGGCVTLHGHILASELADVLARVKAVPGVQEVRSQLESHETAGNLPDLQGEGSLGGRGAFGREHWRPATRLVAIVTGGALVASSRVLGGRAGVLAGLAGAGLLARALTDRRLAVLAGVSRHRRAFEFQKTIRIGAPREQVFAFWSRVENLNRFLSHVREVKELGQGRSRWVFAGPAGVSISWDAELVDYEPNALLEWRSVPSAIVASYLRVRFLEDDRGGTMLDIQCGYDPPAGAIGHMIAKLLGTDPKRVLDEDMLRFKSYMEIGKTTVRGEVAIREDIVTH